MAISSRRWRFGSKQLLSSNGPFIHVAITRPGPPSEESHEPQVSRRPFYGAFQAQACARTAATTC